MVVEESIHVIFDELHLDLNLKDDLVEQLDNLRLDKTNSSKDLNQEEDILKEIFGTMLNPLVFWKDDVNGVQID